MDFNLRPLSYEELCQMDLLHVAANNSNNVNNLNVKLNNNYQHNNEVGDTTTAATATPTTTNVGTATLLPIMVIPTSMFAANANVGANNVIPTTAANCTIATVVPNNCLADNFYATYVPEATFLITQQENSTATETPVNINLTKLFESSTLPRKPHVSHMASGVSMEESDFEGSECGASVSSASTCMPHFRFNACGMMLQPLQQNNQQQQHNNDTLIGCGPFSHMMGSLSALQTSRLMGSLVGGTTAGVISGGTTTTTATTNCPRKRVSFKADLNPPTNGQFVNPGAGTISSSAQLLQMPTDNAYANVMNFDTFMDYQVRFKCTKD